MIGELVRRLRLARRPGAAAGADRHRRRRAAFSAGGDVNWFKGGLDDPEIDLPSDVRRGAEVLHQAIVDFRRIPYPVIGAVNGVAAGAGFSLALMCDIRIASGEAAFVCAYGRIGASPDGGMTYFLPRVVGPGRRRSSCCSTTRCSAPRRRSRWGSSPRSCPPDELIAAARAEGRGAGREGAALRADGEAAGRPRASTTRSPTTCSSSATGSPTRWRPRTCARASTAFFEGREPEFTGD